MPKRNNQIPNGHFHKDWQDHVRTWFNQPARKKRRRLARAQKAAAVFPRPVQGLLRPVVRCSSIKYNMRTKLGRGFTLQELKVAGINKREARGVGIAVDHRRRNKSEQSLRDNVQLLKQFKARLILFPRKPNKKPKHANEVTPAEFAKAIQLNAPLVSLHEGKFRGQARPVDADAKQRSAFVTLRKARADARLIGVRKARREKAEEKAKLAKKE